VGKLSFMHARVADRPAAVSDGSKKERAEAEVRDKTGPWVAPVGRIGLATQGVLYLVVGVLALQVASGHGEDQPSQTGAIEKVADQPFGRFLLLVLAIGLALHCVWRLMLAARGDVGPEGPADIAKRLGQLGRAIIYGGFTVVAVKLLLDAGGQSGSTQQKATAAALDWPGGNVILVIIGLAIIAAGLWNISKAPRRSFEDDLDLTEASKPTRTAVLVAGCIGYVARGIVFALVGWFLIDAAIDHDPNDSGGLDVALKKVADADYGPMTLRVIAIGLFLFGIFRLLDARYRKREELANA